MNQAIGSGRHTTLGVSLAILKWRGLARLCACALLLWAWSIAPAAAMVRDDQPALVASIEGDWLVASRDAVIHIERSGDLYEGRIVWQLHDTYGPEDGAALNGKTVTDRNNPDPTLRSAPLTGLRLLWGLRYDETSGKWRDGRIYDADDGRTYRCQVWMLAADKLNLRGYIGISLLGGNTVWSRVRLSDYNVSRTTEATR